MTLLAYMVAAFLWAHMDYPSACCGGSDCRPVECDSITETADGAIQDGTRYRRGQIFPSTDAHCHACWYPTHDLEGKLVKFPRCLFVVPTT